MHAAALAHCHICGVDIPMAEAKEPTSDGLTIAFDTEWVEEHSAMHRTCTCNWEPDGDHQVRGLPDPQCEAHS